MWSLALYVTRSTFETGEGKTRLRGRVMSLSTKYQFTAISTTQMWGTLLNLWKRRFQNIPFFKLHSLNKYLKGTWDQSNNFWLKLFFLIKKQNGISQNSQMFTCKPKSTYYVCSFACMTSLMLRHNLIIQNFATS